MKAVVAALVCVLPLLAGCLSGGPPFVIVVSSPMIANGMTILVANAAGWFGPVDGRADYVVRYQGAIIYPPGGIGGTIDLVGGKGSTFIPYQHFVIGNGNYDVTVRLNGAEATHASPVSKWVSYVFLQVYCDQSKTCAYGPTRTVTVDSVLVKTPGIPNDRIIAAGTLNIDLRYRGENRELNQYAYGFSVEVPGERTFHRVEIPMNKFNVRQGWYSVDATFHNDQAFGNTWVGNDPNMGANDPPTNWIYVRR